MAKDNFLSYDDRLRRCLKEFLLDQFAEFPNGVVVVARDARIFWMNDRYPKTLGIVNAAAIDKPVTQVIPHTRMHEVVRTGQPIPCEIMAFRDKSFLVTRLPLRDDAGHFGALGIVLSDDTSRLPPDFSRFQRLLVYPAQGQRKLAEAHRAKYTFDDFVGTTSDCRALIQKASGAASIDWPVLILGETGTGKEMLAQSIHNASPRRRGPFVPVNVNAIPIDLFEAEFFGAVRNAATNLAARDGLFKQAGGGTLFLDEIGDMPLALQPKLLRALQEHEIMPVGSNDPTAVNVRVIAATNLNLTQEIKAKRFREDLYHRLNVVSLVSPPLREHLDDLPKFCEPLIKNISRELAVPPPQSVPADFFERLRGYTWSGNVRELENVLRDALLMSKIEGISLLASIERKLRSLTAATASGPATPREIGDAAEREAICEALQKYDGNVTQARKALGTPHATFYEKLRKHGLSPVGFRRRAAD